MATGVFVPDGRLAESWGTHFSVAQDASLPAGAAGALVQVPRLPFHIKFPPGGSAHNHVHPIRLTAARLVYGEEEERVSGASERAGTQKPLGPTSVRS